MRKKRRGKDYPIELSARLEQAHDRHVDPVSRTVFLVGDIENGNARAALTALTVLDQTPGDIRLVLASNGGDVDLGIAIYDAAVTARNKIVVEALGMCQSMGALVLQCGAVRRLGPECRLMVHSGHVAVESGSDVIYSIAREVRYGLRRYCEILAKRSGRPVAEVMKWCRRETYMSAAEAVAVGLADEVIGTRGK